MALRPGDLILVSIGKFKTDLSRKNPGLLVQTPSKWEKDRSWIVGTQFTNGTSQIFPSLDVPQAKAIFRLCLKHPKSLIARLIPLIVKCVDILICDIYNQLFRHCIIHTYLIISEVIHQRQASPLEELTI